MSGNEDVSRKAKRARKKYEKKKDRTKGTSNPSEHKGATMITAPGTRSNDTHPDAPPKLPAMLISPKFTQAHQLRLLDLKPTLAPFFELPTADETARIYRTSEFTRAFQDYTQILEDEGVYTAHTGSRHAVSAVLAGLRDDFWGVIAYKTKAYEVVAAHYGLGHWLTQDHRAELETLWKCEYDATTLGDFTGLHGLLWYGRALQLQRAEYMGWELEDPLARQISASFHAVAGANSYAVKEAERLLLARGRSLSTYMSSVPA